MHHAYVVGDIIVHRPRYWVHIWWFSVFLFFLLLDGRTIKTEKKRSCIHISPTILVTPSVLVSCIYRSGRTLSADGVINLLLEDVPRALDEVPRKADPPVAWRVLSRDPPWQLISPAHRARVLSRWMSSHAAYFIGKSGYVHLVLRLGVFSPWTMDPKDLRDRFSFQMCSLLLGWVKSMQMIGPLSDTFVNLS
jgi:hypothetical protein